MGDAQDRADGLELARVPEGNVWQQRSKVEPQRNHEDGRDREPTGGAEGRFADGMRRRDDDGRRPFWRSGRGWRGWRRRLGAGASRSAAAGSASSESVASSAPGVSPPSVIGSFTIP